MVGGGDFELRSEPHSLFAATRGARALTSTRRYFPDGGDERFNLLLLLCNQGLQLGDS